MEDFTGGKQSKNLIKAQILEKKIKTRLHI